jgi:hypothetical protein
LTYREAALRVAISQIGVTEHPPKSNWGPQVAGYLASTGIKAPAPWCMAFVHWCYERAGVELGGGASVGNFQAWAKQHGELVAVPERGDIVCYQFDADNWPDHVGIVERAAGRSIHTVEGNTAYGDDANGGQVMRRVRTVSRCAFVRVPGSKPAPQPARVDVQKNGKRWLVGQKLASNAWVTRARSAIRAGAKTVTVRRHK